MEDKILYFGGSAKNSLIALEMMVKDSGIIVIDNKPEPLQLTNHRLPEVISFNPNTRRDKRAKNKKPRIKNKKL